MTRRGGKVRVRLCRIALLAGGVFPACVDPAAAQTPAPTRLAADSLADGVAWLGVGGRPWSTVVAITVLVPRGSAEDPPELSGASRLLAELVKVGLERRLAPGEARISVEVTRGHTLFQALAVPAAWGRVQRELLDAVFSAPLPADAVAAVRDRLAATARFEVGAPVREFQDELYRLMDGGDPRWSRNPLGASETLRRLDNAILSAVRGRQYRRAEAVVTLVGPLGIGTSLEVRQGRGAAPSPAASGVTAAGPPRRRLGREVTNSWIGAAFPVPASVPRTLLEFMRHRVSEELNPDPPDPGLFGAELRIEELAGGTVLLVETAVLPEAEGRWEERVVRAVKELGERHRDPGFFRFQRRRFRTALLVNEGAPEVVGARMAFDLLREGRIRDLGEEVDRLDPAALARAVEALGEPRVLLFGPEMGGDRP